MAVNPFDPNTIEDQNPEDITVDTLVGEGRKYKDPNELAKAYASADAYIASLKADQVAREAELKVYKDIAEARQKVDPNAATPPVRQEPPVQEQQKTETPDISELVRKELATSTEEKRKADNINRAAEVMNNHYGSPAKAQEAMRRRADELGVSFDWLRDAASNSPQAFFATMGVPQGSVRQPSTPGYQPEVVIRSSGASVQNFKYFEDLRKSNPKLYFSADVQKQMFSARRELGDKFYTA